MENIKISNFRKIKETWDLELAPITFFTGKNNSGKSSVLKGLMVLSDFCNSENHFEISFNGKNKDEHKIKDYSNAINWKNNNKSNLEFDFIRKGYNFNFIFKPKVNPYNSKSDEDHYLAGELVSLKIKRIEDNALLEIFHNNGGCQMNIDDNYINRKFSNLNSFNPELEQLNQALKGIEKELEEIENDIKDKLSKNPNLASLLGITAGGVGAIVASSLVTILSGPLFLAGLGVAGGAKLLSSMKGRELVEQKKKAEKLLTSRKNIQKKLDKLNSQENTRGKETNILRPKFDLITTSNSGLEIDKILKSQLTQYLNTHEKELGKSNIREDNGIIHSFADNILNSMSMEIFHLSPNRNRQTRLYVNRNADADVNELLENYSEVPLLLDSEENKFLKKWLLFFEIGTDYKISNISGQANTVEIFDENKWIDLVDKGFGAGQLFTILLQIAMSSSSNISKQGKVPPAPILLIEEPESNLHPKLQSDLVKMFLDSYYTLGVRFIIETHSEYIIRKTQLEGLERNFFLKENQDKNPFKVYYFGQNGPYEMKYKEDAKFERSFDPGFFNVADDLEVKAYQLNLIKKKNA